MDLDHVKDYGSIVGRGYGSGDRRRAGIRPGSESGRE